MSALMIANTQVRQDKGGRYSLNDLHKAAGSEERHSPNRWSRTDSYSGLVLELTPELALAPVEVRKGGLRLAHMHAKNWSMPMPCGSARSSTCM